MKGLVEIGGKAMKIIWCDLEINFDELSDGNKQYILSCLQGRESEAKE